MPYRSARCTPAPTGPRSDGHPVDKSGKRFGVNAMCAMGNRGKRCFTVCAGSFTVTVVIDFLERLIATVGRKVHLVVDGHPAHRSRAVRAWLNTHASPIETHFPPGYAPERDLVEILNGDVKKHVAEADPHTKADLAAHLRSHLRRRQNPGFIRSLFGKPAVAYAATQPPDTKDVRLNKASCREVNASTASHNSRSRCSSYDSADERPTRPRST